MLGEYMTVGNIIWENMRSIVGSIKEIRTTYFCRLSIDVCDGFQALRD